MRSILNGTTQSSPDTPQNRSGYCSGCPKARQAARTRRRYSCAWRSMGWHSPDAPRPLEWQTTPDCAPARGQLQARAMPPATAKSARRPTAKPAPKARRAEGPKGATRKAKAAPRVGIVSPRLPQGAGRLASASSPGCAPRATCSRADYAGADVVVVNTCGFLDSAKQESLDAIGEALAENGRVIVTGCLGVEEALHPRRPPGRARRHRPAPVRGRWSTPCTTPCRRCTTPSSTWCRPKACA